MLIERLLHTRCNESQKISLFFPKVKYFMETCLLQAESTVRWSRQTVTLQVSITLHRCSHEVIADVCKDA